MFRGTTAFNGDMSGWNTSSVTNMQSMFTNAAAFNGDVSGFDTSGVPNMQLMFYGAAKGLNYASLAHQYHRFIDFSHHLKSGRAVLLGRSQQVATEITLNGDAPPAQTRAHWTYYRLQLPVQAER